MPPTVNVKIEPETLIITAPPVPLVNPCVAVTIPAKFCVLLIVVIPEFVVAVILSPATMEVIIPLN